jgi:hypothetical protein
LESNPPRPRTSSLDSSGECGGRGCRFTQLKIALSTAYPGMPAIHPVFADRYHAHVLDSRREVANAVRYVTGNYRHHAREWLPPHFRDSLATRADAPLAEPRLWLLRIGWRAEPQRKALCFEPP